MKVPYVCLINDNWIAYYIRFRYLSIDLVFKFMKNINNVLQTCVSSLVRLSLTVL